MRAAILYELKVPLAVESVDVRSPGEGEVLVRVAASGVCHTDLTIIEGALQTMPEPRLPMVLGHEGAGVVEGVGPGVTTVAAGDHVVLCGGGCGKCRYCAIGRPMLCLRWSNLAGSPRFRKDGREVFHFGSSTFAEYTVVAESTCIRIREDAPLDRVCLLGCGVMTGIGAVINTAKVSPGSNVLVIGCGGVGLNVVQGAALAGAAKIIAVDVLENKLELAKRFGATYTMNARNEDVVSSVKDLTGGLGVDYSFEVIATVPTIRQAFDCLAPNGLCVVVGSAPPGSEVPIPTAALFFERGIRGTFLGSARPAFDIPRLVDLYMEKKIKLDELISQTLPLDDINKAFDDLKGGAVARTVIRY